MEEGGHGEEDEGDGTQVLLPVSWAALGLFGVRALHIYKADGAPFVDLGPKGFRSVLVCTLAYQGHRMFKQADKREGRSSLWKRGLSSP